MRIKTLISKLFCPVIILKQGKDMGINTDGGDLKTVDVNTKKPPAIHARNPATKVIRRIPLGLVGTRMGGHLIWPVNSIHVSLPKSLPW